MAKPPKQIPPASSSPPRSLTDTPPVNVDHVSNIRPGTHLPTVELTFAGHSSQHTADHGGGKQPSVEVSEMLTRQHPHGSVIAPDASARPTSPVFIPVHLALRLTPAADSPQGIRRDGRERTYVDMREGTAMVHQHPDGRYQLTSASELTPSGFQVERIHGTNLWQKRQAIAARRPHVDEPDEQAGPSKRPRLNEDDASTDPDPFADKASTTIQQPLDLSSKPWRSWGQPTKPTSGQSVEVDGLHYPIVSQIVRSNTPIVCIKHPRFNPERFEAFEQMLVDNRTLQPRWAARAPDNRWVVADDHLPFEKPLTQYVADTFEYLSGQSARAVAKAMFSASRGAEVINGEGLQALSQTFRYWENRTIPAHRQLADPLMLLPIQPIIDDGTFGRGIVLPPTSGPSLQRVDIDPQKFSQQWNEYTAEPGAASLQKLFYKILVKSGYTVSPPDPLLLENSLVFRREGLDSLFVLKLPLVSSDFIPRYTRPGSELTSSAALMTLDETGRQRLNTLLAQDKINYLVGGIQRPSPDQPTLFILREG